MAIVVIIVMIYMFSMMISNFADGNTSFAIMWLVGIIAEIFVIAAVSGSSRRP